MTVSPERVASLEQRLDLMQRALSLIEEVDEARGIPVTASGGPRGATGDSMVSRMNAVNGRPQASPTQPRFTPANSSSVTVTAAVGGRGIPAGTALQTEDQLAAVMAQTLQAWRPGDGRREVVCASATWDFPEERKLTSDPYGNDRKIETVCGLNANRFDPSSGSLVASGGICLPVNVDYAVPTWSTADRPLRDGLPSFQADRGGLRYVTPPDIGVPTLQGGTASGAGLSAGVWTEATDANPAGATKPVWVVPCGTEQITYVGAVTTRVQFGNMQSRFAPEQIAADTQQAVSVSARQAELSLLTQIANNSKQVPASQYLGATRDILATLDRLRAQYIHSHRISRNAAFTAIFPDWAKDVMRADLVREMAHDNAGVRDVLAVSDNDIESWFGARNVNVIWTLDALQAGTYGTGGTAIPAQYFPIATAGAQPVWPGQSTGSDHAFLMAWFLFVEGSFQHLDGGQLNLGVVRDSLLDSTNDYETFTEVFEGIAFRGLECYQVQQQVFPAGGSAGTVATSGYQE